MPKRKAYSKKGRRRVKRRYSRAKATKKQVRTMIRKALKPHTEVIRKVLNFDATISQTVNWFHLNPIQVSNNIFDTADNDQHQNQAKHVRIDMDFLLEAASENDGVTFTMYLVSPKNTAQDVMFDGATGQLNIAQAEHYSYHSGVAFVNPDCWTIHRRWSAFFPPHAVGEVSKTLFKRKRVTIRPNTFIKNIRGDFKDLVCPQKPSQNYYLLVFNNNSISDLESPQMKLVVLNTYIA